MELEKIRNLSDEELRSQQDKAAEQLFRLRFQKSLGNNEGIKKLRGLKLDIARIQTIARERTIAAEKAANARPSKRTAPASEHAHRRAKRRKRRRHNHGRDSQHPRDRSRDARRAQPQPLAATRRLPVSSSRPRCR